MAQADSVPTPIARRSQARPRRRPQSAVLPIVAISSAAPMLGSLWAMTRLRSSGFGARSAARSSRRTSPAISSSSSA